MKVLNNKIMESIENHILDIEHEAYLLLEETLGRKELEKLSFYLESEQDEKFQHDLNELLTNPKIKIAIQALYPNKNQVISTKGISFNMEEGETCTIFYGTNREPNDPSDLSKGYGNERSHELRLGSCPVSIPKSKERVKGQTRGSLWQKIINFNASYGDIQLNTPTECNSDKYWQSIASLLAPLEPEEQQALVFVHGFNTSFEDAAMRATQISVDLEHKGITAFFSWASKGKALSYISDAATIQYSERHLTEFLTDFAQKSNAKRIHIIAHSMGNRALLEAVNRIQQTNPEVQFGQIILAAPDVDADVFEELSDAYTKLSEQTTLYISKQDKAVGMSKWLHAYNRAGFTPPVCMVQGINTIEVEEEVNLLELGHGYFAQQSNLLEDMKKLIQLNLDANHRDKLQVQKATHNHQYWKIQGE